jgi:hypothetical protein
MRRTKGVRLTSPWKKQWERCCSAKKKVATATQERQHVINSVGATTCKEQCGSYNTRWVMHELQHEKSGMKRVASER